MKIIPEQISQLRQERLKLKTSLAGYSDYLRSKEKTSSEISSCGIIGDSLIDSQFHRELDSSDTVTSLLTNSEYVRVRPTDEVGIGSKCVLRFKDDDETSTITLTEFLYGLSHERRFVSISSPIGKAIIGKKVGEEFKATVVEGKPPKVVRTIEGTIEEIKSEKEEYLHFIRERELTDRKSSAAKKELKELRASTSDEAAQTLQGYQTITESQRYLLLIEQEQLSRHKKTPLTSSRLTKVNKLLATSPLAVPPTDGTIGVGTTFDIVLTDGETSETRHYEMINQAVSDELEDAYVERVDTLGSKLYGLKTNDMVKYRKNGKTYQVAVMNVDVPKMSEEKANTASHQYQKN